MSKVWDDIKNFFKPKDKLEEEKNEAIRKALEEEKSITAKLSETEKRYLEGLPKEETPDLNGIFPESLGLKEVEYKAKSDEELAKIAEGEYAPKLDAEAEKLNAKYDGSTEKQVLKAESAERDYDEKLKQIEKDFEEAVKKTKISAIDKGLARSSILESAQSDNEEDKEIKSQEKLAAFNTQIAEIEKQIELLNTERDAALDALELDYAAKISKRMTDLADDRDKMVLQTEKYNNTVREKENAYIKQREKDMADYLNRLEKYRLDSDAKKAESEKKYGYDAEKQQNYAERYQIAYDFYMSLSDDIAAEALAASPNMKYYLGNYYDQLMNVLKKKEQSGRVYY